MFSNLFNNKKAKSCQIADEVYLSEAAKNKAIVREAGENSSIIYITWFTKTTTLLKELFAASGLDEMRIVEARFFNTQKYPGKLFICTEHYPLPGKEDELITNLPQKEIKVYSAVTDPLFKAFGGEKIVALMKNIGVQEDESLTHSMISKSIRRAQEKLEESISLEQSANSQEEWFMRNGFGKVL